MQKSEAPKYFFFKSSRLYYSNISSPGYFYYGTTLSYLTYAGLSNLEFISLVYVTGSAIFLGAS